MAALINREIIFLLLEFLDEENLKKTARILEKETGFFFNMRYLEEMITNGEWDEVESYLSSFTWVQENRHSTKIFFEIRKQKYLEALDKEVDKLCSYRDAKSARILLFIELRRLIQANPVFREKLQFSLFAECEVESFDQSWVELAASSLRNSKPHSLCEIPLCGPYLRRVDAVVIQLLVHMSSHTSSAGANALIGPMLRGGGFMPTGAPVPLTLYAPSPITSPARMMASSFSLPNLAISVRPMSLNPTTSDSELALGRSLSVGARGEPNNMQIEEPVPSNAQLMYMQIEEAGLSNARPLHMQVDEAGPSNSYPLYSYDDLPRSVVANLNQVSAVRSMDFHSVRHTVLLVGTITGDVSIWEVGCGRMLTSRKFKVWDIGACSLDLQVSLANDYSASVTCVRWYPDGNGFGVAYSKHMVQLLSYHGGDDFINHLEVEAHIGSVNDLAFYHRNKQLLFITCGEDRIVKVWDAATGTRQHTMEGHDSPVYSVCPHTKEGVDFIFSTDINGNIKAWLYGERGARVNYEAPGRSCSTVAYSADGTRLFYCGTNREGESHFVELNDSEGTLKRTYLGLGRQTVLEKVHFHTTKNRYLAAGDQYAIKYWDMDNINLLCTVDADGGLPASPCIRFNKLGTLLAVSTNENSVKILANAAGSQLLRFIGDHTGTSSKDDVVNPVFFNEKGKTKISRPIEINERSQLRSLKLPDRLLAVRIMQLVYTNSGDCILALTCNAIHILWKWRRNDTNVDGMVTTGVVPQIWQPSGAMLMTNDLSDMNLGEVRVPCFTISKNDGYLTSSSGGKISLFNMMTFKRVGTFMTPPPPTTSLAFFPPDNNVIAIGRGDAAILVYNIRMDELIATLNGHRKRVTALAFSTALDVLVSLGEDAKLCLWSTSVWKKKASKWLQIAPECTTNPHAQSRLQFHRDQTHILVFHKMLIAIYNAIKLECINQWYPERSSSAITDATFSCDGQSIYAAFEDGSVGIFFARTLQIRCQINPTAYVVLPTPSSRIYPLVVAAHPIKPNQFAVGLSDSTVCVLEPVGTEENWGVARPSSSNLR